MNKGAWQFRLWKWVGVRILRCPYTVNFTPPDSDIVVGIGFAWDQQTAIKMQANYVQLPPKLTRAQRRALKSSARSVAEEVQS